MGHGGERRAGARRRLWRGVGSWGGAELPRKHRRLAARSLVGLIKHPEGQSDFGLATHRTCAAGAKLTRRRGPRLIRELVDGMLALGPLSRARSCPKSIVAP